MTLSLRFEQFFRRYQRHMADVMAPIGIAPGTVSVLAELYRKDNVTQAHLCRAVGVEQPTMAKTLNRMERDGLITRTHDKSDKRRAFVRLTDKAVSMSGAFARELDEIERLLRVVGAELVVENAVVFE